jgi:hypothetical protein
VLGYGFLAGRLVGVLFYKVTVITLGVIAVVDLFSCLWCPFFEILSLPQKGHVTFTIFDTVQMLT